MSTEIAQTVLGVFVIVTTTTIAAPLFYLALRLMRASRAEYRESRRISGSAWQVFLGRAGSNRSSLDTGDIAAGMQADLRDSSYRRQGRLSDDRLDRILT